ncbi:oxidoreductase [Jeotgalibacillus salarius]|uniref:Oxidoreductase n=1 Tax=Jeotgalibacillus salarius TaxID=546023 RepID=A0A4Y8LC23_9BACL|nr:oxidoreductase [Jeotgalibacillus salarius]TFD99720.1 oxidoreductase [Jeotgalibacillus salarius]
MRTRTAAVIGSNTATGHELIKELCSRSIYGEVIVLSDRKTNLIHHKISERIIDFRYIEASHFGLVDDVFCCVQPDRKNHWFDPLQTAAAAKKSNASQYLAVSSMGADPQSVLKLNRLYGVYEKQLKTLNLPSLHIFRPSILLTDPGEFRVKESAAAKFIAFTGWAMMGPFKTYKGIRASQLALAMTEKALNGRSPEIVIYKSGEIENTKRRETET